MSKIPFHEDNGKCKLEAKLKIASASITYNFLKETEVLPRILFRDSFTYLTMHSKNPFQVAALSSIKLPVIDKPQKFFFSSVFVIFHNKSNSCFSLWNFFAMSL